MEDILISTMLKSRKLLRTLRHVDSQAIGFPGRGFNFFFRKFTKAPYCSSKNTSMKAHFWRGIKNIKISVFKRE